MCRDRIWVLEYVDLTCVNTRFKSTVAIVAAYCTMVAKKRIATTIYDLKSCPSRTLKLRHWNRLPPRTFFVFHVAFVYRVLVLLKMPSHLLAGIAKTQKLSLSWIGLHIVAIWPAVICLSCKLRHINTLQTKTTIEKTWDNQKKILGWSADCSSCSWFHQFLPWLSINVFITAEVQPCLDITF